MMLNGYFDLFLCELHRCSFIGHLSGRNGAAKHSGHWKEICRTWDCILGGLDHHFEGAVGAHPLGGLGDPG